MASCKTDTGSNCMAREGQRGDTAPLKIEHHGTMEEDKCGTSWMRNGKLRSSGGRPMKHIIEERLIFKERWRNTSEKHNE